MDKIVLFDMIEHHLKDEYRFHYQESNIAIEINYSYDKEEYVLFAEQRDGTHKFTHPDLEVILERMHYIMTEFGYKPLQIDGEVK